MLLILPPFGYDPREENARLAQTASCLGWSVHHSGISWRMPKNLIGHEGAVHGTPYFCQVVADQMGWDLLANPIDWITTLSEEHIRRNIVLSTLGDAKRLTEKKFIRPAEEDHLFPAKVYEDGSKIQTNTVFDNASVLVSDTIPYMTEWRCFVKDRHVVSVCCYRFNKEINQKHLWCWDVSSATDFVNKMLRDESVSCVSSTIDVGRSKKGFMSVIETSPAWASDTFGCELVGTLDSIKASCIMRK